MTMRVAIIGFGKIAGDEHVPAIAADPDFELVAVVAPSGDPGAGVRWFADPAQMLEKMGGSVDAVAICTPPMVRYTVARQMIEAGVAVLLEKPPAATLGEIDGLVAAAHDRRTALYAGWHSQHAAGVPLARAALTGEHIVRLAINWREDVRKWHPGQQWIWRAGGFGVFDPGINGLSIATRILPMPLLVASAELHYPSNRQAPIAADILFHGTDMAAHMDWRGHQDEDWRISVETADGKVVELREGGQQLLIDGSSVPVGPTGEYASIYRRFAKVIRARDVDVDKDPLRIVADAFLVGQRSTVEAFEDAPAAETGEGNERGEMQ